MDSGLELRARHSQACLQVDGCRLPALWCSASPSIQGAIGEGAKLHHALGAACEKALGLPRTMGGRGAKEEDAEGQG